MTHEQLIETARAHTKDLPRVSGDPLTTDEVLNKITVQDAIIVRFESDQHSKKVMILLDKESGKFVASWLTPQPSV